MITLALFLLLAPLSAWALHRDIRRAVARRRLRRLATSLPALAASFVGFGQSMAQAVAAAQRFEEAMRSVQVTLTVDTSKFEDALRRAQENLR